MKLCQDAIERLVVNLLGIHKDAIEVKYNSTEHSLSSFGNYGADKCGEIRQGRFVA